MARQRIINYHTSGTTAPSSSDIYYGELVVSHNSIGNTKIYTKVTNPSGDTESGKIATFIDEPQIDEKISNSVNGLATIVQNLANLTITDIKATTPISATEKAIVAESCGNTVTISHVANKTAQSGFKKLTTDTYGHVTGGVDVVIGDISGLNGFSDAIKGAETKLAYSSAGTGNAVTSISVNDHTITANFGKEFSEAGHEHDGSDITSGKVGIDYLPTSSAVTSTSDNTTMPTSKAVYDAVSGVVNGLDKEASSVQGQFVRTVIQENGLVSESKDFINVNDVKLSAVTPSSTTVKEEYALYNGNGVKLGDSIKVYKDQSLVSITLEDNDGSGKTGQYLKYTYIDVNGDTQSTYVNISSLLVEAEFKDGLVVNGNGEVKVKIDSTSESFLTVGEQGVKLSGVKEEITRKIAALDVTDAAEAGRYVSAVNETDGKISVERANVSDAVLNGYEKGVKPASTVITATDKLKDAIAKLEHQIDNAKAAATTKVVEGTDEGNNMTIVPTTGDDESVTYTVNLTDVASKTALDAEIAARKAVDGQAGQTYAANTNSNYISAVNSLNAADVQLDAILGKDETAGAGNSGNTVFDTTNTVAKNISDIKKDLAAFKNKLTLSVNDDDKYIATNISSDENGTVITVSAITKDISASENGASAIADSYNVKRFAVSQIKADAGVAHHASGVEILDSGVGDGFRQLSFAKLTIDCGEF